MKRKKIKTGWLEYFNFSARERRGAAFLSLIIILQIFFIILLRNSVTQIPPPDHALIAQIIALKEKTHVTSTAVELQLRAPSVIIPFDPNKIDSTIALAAGLTDRQMKVILNYLAKGGVFRTKKDFSRMYCIPEFQFKKLEPFLLLPDSIKQADKKKFQHKSVRVDIGTADSLTLMQLRGIGPVFASRIIKYREKLGGFYSKDQLREVFGMKDSLFDAISPFITLNDTLPFRYIHLNSDSSSILASHPYIRWKLAGIICSYRVQHQIISPADITALPLVNEEIFRKLAPYLKTD